MAKSSLVNNNIMPVTGKDKYVYSTPEKPRTRPCAYSAEKKTTGRKIGDEDGQIKLHY